MVDSNLDVVVRGRDELTPSLAEIQSKLIRFVGFVSSALATIKIAAFPVDSVREFEKEMAGVQKTTGFTNAQIKTLGDSLINMSRDINVSAADLAKIAAAAGQQGLGREGVEGVRQFTESVSRMASVLDITVEQAGTDVGKIASIFKIPLRDIENAVSAFNQVSNNSTASGEQLLDVVKRIGDAAGSLNLQQSIGLSATGIDLGLSPEVVGSSFQKVFAEMYARAGQFSKLLGTDVNTWIHGLQSNGIDALKQYLAGLRKLTPQAQQEVIKALSGGGRIGSLVTKLLQDTEDTILNRNVQNAVDGITTGTSAIKEQQTVLATLDAQIVKAGNSFKALGIIAGEEFGTKLSAYFSQLNTALAKPAVVDFAKAVGQSFLDLFTSIATGIQYISSLNIKWTDFITVAKVFIGLKLASIFAGMLTNLPLISGAWGRLATTAAAAGDAQVAASGKQEGAIARQVTALRALMAEHAEYQAILAREAAAEEAKARAQVENDNAQAASLAARNAQAAGLRTVRAANAPVTAAKAGVSAAEQSATASTLAVQTAQNARLEQAAQQHAQRLNQIELERIRLQSVARDNGDRSALLAATRARNEQVAAEKASYQRSLTGINSYYTRRLAVVEQAGAAEIAAAKATLAASLSTFDGVVKTAGVTALTAASNTATVALNGTREAVAATTVQLTLAQEAALLARRSFSFLATGVRLAATAFQGLIAIASKVFFWLTIVYTVLQATGGLDYVATFFQKLTDYMGFTSEAGRKLEEQHNRTILAQKELKKSADDAAESILALQKVQDKDTGQLSEKSKAAFKIGLSSKDRDEYMKVLDDVVKATAGAQTQLEQLSGSQKFSLIQVADLEAQRGPILAEIDKLQTAYEQRVKDFGAQAAAGGPGAGIIKQAKDNLDEQQALLASIDKDIKDLGGKNAASIQSQIGQTKKDLEDLQGIISNTFTPLSAQTFANFAQPYLDAVKAKKQADADYTVVNKKLSDETDEVKRKSLQVDVDTAFAKSSAATGAVKKVREDLAANIAELKKSGGLSEATIGSLDALTGFLDKTETVVGAILASIFKVQKSGGTFSGEQAPPSPKPAEGTDVFKPVSESELRRQRKARADLIRAGLEAEANLEKEHNAQVNDDNEDAYKQNTKSIKDYYAERLRLQRENLDIELKLQQNQTANLRDELAAANAVAVQNTNQAATPEDRDKAQADGNSEQLRIQAQIVQAEGQVKVLQAQKDVLSKDNDRALRDALRDFSDRVHEQRTALAEFFGDGSDQQAFERALEDGNQKYRDFINRLTAESKDMPELLPLIDNIKLEIAFEAVEKAIQGVSRESAIANSYLDITSQKITALGEAGLLSRAQVSALEEKNRLAVVAVKEAENDRDKQLLAQLDEQSGGLAQQTTKYKELQLEIAKRSGEIDNLKTKGNEVANTINKDIASAVNQALVDITTPGKTFSEVFTDFLLSIVNSLRNVAAQGLTDLIMQQLKSVAGGGIGGFFSDLFGGSAQSLEKTGANAAKTVANVADTATKAVDTTSNAIDSVRGSTPATPIYTTDAKAALNDLTKTGEGGGAGGSVLNLLGKGNGGKASEGIASPATDATNAVPSEGFFSDTFNSLGDQVSELGTTVVDGLGKGLTTVSDAVVSGGQQLLSFLGTMLSGLMTAIFGASTASAGAGAAGGIAGVVGAAAHNGGIAGRTTMRRTGVSASAFTDAVRYHTGGKAGLAPNEVPVILQKGEEVLTQQDPRHQDNIGSGSGLNPNQAQMSPIFKVQPVLSEGAVLDAMKGSAGEKLLLVHIGRNTAAFRNALKIDN